MLQIFITGGTIDKDYDSITGELIFPKTSIPSMLSQANLAIDINTKVLFKKDSLYITKADRKTILQACKKTSAKQIVITHGTDTMPKTAKYLNKHFGKHLKNKTIVLTGAMRPFSLGNSDALFNLGSALMAVQTANSGVFIAMNGQLLKANNVVKNNKIGVFKSNIVLFG